jgi:hypothetical protein
MEVALASQEVVILSEAKDLLFAGDEQNRFSQNEPLARRSNLTVFMQYNDAHAWPSPLARNSVPTKSYLRSEQAAWAKSTAAAMRV